MSIIGSNVLAGASGQAGAAAYEIEQSLRFNDDDTAHFDRTPSSVGARATWTYSVWVKGSDFSGDANTLLSGGNYAYGTFLWFRDGGHIALGRYFSGSYTFLVEADGFYRDPTAWYHIVCVFDSSQATASDRVKLYVNGEQITSFTTANYPSSNFETDINNDGIQWIGERGYDSSLKLHGYLAEAHLVDGSPLEPTSFGEYDENGVWRPIEVELTGANDGTTWSDYLTDTGGSFQASYPATKAFNGTTDAANTARASTSGTTSTFEPPTDITYTSSVEVWTYYAGSVSLNGGSAVSVNNDQAWRTIATGSGSLDTLAFTASGSSNVYIGAIRIDGVVLIDGNSHQYGKNGFYLKFDPDATNGIGHDHSGNGNNWTANNFSTTAGSGYDVMSDTPTTNYMTFNPLDTSRDISSSFYVNNGNLDLNVTNNSSYRNLSATFWPEGLKGYFEVTISTGTPNFHIGFTDFDRVLTKSDYTVSNINYHIRESGKVYNGPTAIHSSYLSAFSSGDTLGVAFDFTGSNKNVWFSKNGTFGSTSGGAGDPAAGTNPALTTTQLDVEQRFYFAINTGSGLQTISLNTGQRDFEDTPPSGFKAVNTSNISAPEIKDGSEYFNTVLWTGNATARDITTGHNSNFTWIKHRNSAENHNLYDILRGTGVRLESNSTSQETSYSDRLTAFNSDGFSLGTGYNNTSSTTYVGWSWAGGGSGSSNTNGTVTSTVSAIPSAGFSIVSFDSGAAGNKTVGHGLGVAPAMYITKKRDSAGSWSVFHKDFANPAQGYMLLNSQNGVVNDSRERANAAPTSTVFSFESGYTFAANENIIAYCFAEVEGYSKIGSYTGNGSSDGPFIYTGFTVAWLMVKKNANSTDWKIYDAGREPYNVVANRIAANTTNVELDGNAQDIDFLSNGFKFRGTNGDQNSSGTFYYVAFASSPFGGSGVSPATAR